MGDRIRQEGNWSEGTECAKLAAPRKSFVECYETRARSLRESDQMKAGDGCCRRKVNQIRGHRESRCWDTADRGRPFPFSSGSVTRCPFRRWRKGITCANGWPRHWNVARLEPVRGVHMPGCFGGWSGIRSSVPGPGFWSELWSSPPDLRSGRFLRPSPGLG
jgi:hypothetical protein